MPNNIPFKSAAILALSLAMLSLAPGAAAQEDPMFVTTECGAGRTEVCGERTTYKCGWEWGWMPWHTFPYIMYAPKYECEGAIKDLMYKHSSRGEIKTPSDQL